MSNKLVPILSTIGIISLLAIGVYRNSDAKVVKDQEPIQQYSEHQFLANLESPYEIAAYINEHNDDANLNELWEKFRIEPDFGKPGRCGCRGYDCPGTCKAQAITASPNGEHGSYVFLRVCYAGEADCWFLVFKKEPEWRYIGIVESVRNQYQPPQHRIIHFKEDLFLTVKELTGRGTGFLDYAEYWYEINEKAPKLILSYPVLGHSVQGEKSDYEYKSKSRIDTKEQLSINLRYTILRDAAEDNPNLEWHSSYRYFVHFVWDTELKKFVFDNSIQWK